MNMNKVSKIIIVLTILIKNSFNLTLPSNPMHQTGGIEMGAKTYDLSSTYNSSAAPVTLNQSIDVTLNISQPNVIYQAGVVFSNLYLTTGAFQIIDILDVILKTTTSLTFAFTSYPGNCFAVLEVRYIVVPSNISSITMHETYSVIGSSIYVPSNSTYTYPSTSSAYNFNASATFIIFYRGSKYFPNSTDLSQFGLQFTGAYVSPTSANINIKNIASYGITLNQIHALLFYYDPIQLQNSLPNLVIVSGSLAYNISTMNFIGFGFSAERSVFFGMTKFNSINTTSFSFKLTITNSSLVFQKLPDFSDYSASYFILAYTNRHAYCPSSAPLYDGSGLCFSTCPSGYTKASSGYLCYPFNIVGCLICNAASKCLVCSSGRLVNNSCTNISGCLVVNQSLSINNNCQTCSLATNFQQIPALKTCVCKTNYTLVTNACINNYGCIHAFDAGDQVICKFCNVRNFSLFGNFCQCLSAHVYNTSTNKCQDICGDGIVYNEACDDNNQYNGDGCSSMCTVETNFKCINGISKNPSKCSYTRHNLDLKVISIRKTIGQDEGVFKIQITPTLKLFNYRRVIGSLIFQCQQNTTKTKWSENNGIVTIFVSYTENLEGNSVTVFIAFNQSFIEQKSMNITFRMISDDLQLVLCSYSHIDQLKQFLFIVSIVILALFLTSSFFHKMMGVQFIHTFQLIYFISALVPHPSEASIIFRQLTFLNLNWRYLWDGYINFYLFNGFQEYSSAEGYQTKFQLLMIVGISLLAYVIIRKISSQQLCFTSKMIIRLFKRISGKIYTIIIFPICIAFIFQGALTISPSESSSSDNRLINLPLIIFISIIFALEWKQLFISRIKPSSMLNLHNCNKNYLPIYLTFAFFHFIIISIANLGLFPNFLYLLSPLVSLQLIWFIQTKAYTSTIHNIAQINNLLLPVWFMGWNIYRMKYLSTIQDDIQIFATSVFCIMIILTFIFHLIRIIVEIKKLIQQRRQIANRQKGYMLEQVRIDQNKQIRKQFEKYNQYICQISIIKQKLANSSQKARITHQQNIQQLNKKLKYIRQSIGGKTSVWNAKGQKNQNEYLKKYLQLKFEMHQHKKQALI